MTENKKKIKFYDIVVISMILSFVIAFISVFIISSEQFENTIIIYPWLIILGLGILCGIIFTIGMAYHSYKIKKYGWLFVIIFLGTIFPLIFYFSTIRKEFKKG